jgi:hypothetical protein
MKNQYFGDVKDYFKYGLLRCCAESGFRVGVCWMLTPDDNGKDGRKIEFLSAPHDWRHHDPSLFDQLKKAVVQERVRDTRRVHELIPQSRFWSELVPEVVEARKKWLAACLGAFEDTSLWFFDPDNGLETSSVSHLRRRSIKHVFWDEVGAAWANGHSLLIFQHFAREDHGVHTQRLVEEMTRHLPNAAVVPLRTGQVLYLLASRPEHSTQTTAVLRLLQAHWGSRLVPVSSGWRARPEPPARHPSVWRELGHVVRTLRNWLGRR